MGNSEAIILGIIQGLTEFLPVSSSGHLVIFQDILGVQEAGITFEVMLHFGTLLSVIWVFGRDIIRLARDFRQGGQGRHFVLMLLLGIIPTGLMGILLKDAFESFYAQPLLTGIMLFLTGVILFTLSRLTPGRKNERTMTAKDALLISVAQGIAIIPGISRSGSTITAALWLGLDQQTAVKFSFLVSIPVIFGATLFELKDVLAFGFTGINSSLVIGTLASLFTGIFAIRIFVNLLQKGKFHFFAYYCWFAGAVTILYKIFFS